MAASLLLCPYRRWRAPRWLRRRDLPRFCTVRRVRAAPRCLTGRSWRACCSAVKAVPTLRQDGCRRAILAAMLLLRTRQRRAATSRRRTIQTGAVIRPRRKPRTRKPSEERVKYDALKEGNAQPERHPPERDRTKPITRIVERHKLYTLHAHAPPRITCGVPRTTGGSGLSPPPRRAGSRSRAAARELVGHRRPDGCRPLALQRRDVAAAGARRQRADVGRRPRGRRRAQQRLVGARRAHRREIELPSGWAATRASCRRRRGSCALGRRQRRRARRRRELLVRRGDEDLG